MSVWDIAFVVYLLGIPIATWSGLDAERALLPFEERRPIQTALLAVVWPATLLWGLIVIWRESDPVERFVEMLVEKERAERSSQTARPQVPSEESKSSTRDRR